MVVNWSRQTGLFHSCSSLVSITSRLPVSPALSSLKDPVIYSHSVVVPLKCQLLSALEKWQVGPYFKQGLRLELPVWVRRSIVKDDSLVEIVPQQLCEGKQEGERGRRRRSFHNVLSIPEYQG